MPIVIPVALLAPIRRVPADAVSSEVDWRAEALRVLAKLPVPVKLAALEMVWPLMAPLVMVPVLVMLPVPSVRLPPTVAIDPPLVVNPPGIETWKLDLPRVSPVALPVATASVPE